MLQILCGKCDKFVAVILYYLSDVIALCLVRCSLKRLLDHLLVLQTTMLASNPDTKPMLQAGDSSSLQHSKTL